MRQTLVGQCTCGVRLLSLTAGTVPFEFATPPMRPSKWSEIEPPLGRGGGTFGRPCRGVHRTWGMRLGGSPIALHIPANA